MLKCKHISHFKENEFSRQIIDEILIFFDGMIHQTLLDWFLAKFVMFSSMNIKEITVKLMKCHINRQVFTLHKEHLAFPFN